MQPVLARLPRWRGRPAAPPERHLRELRAEVDRCLRGNGPVLAGPWRGDLGYELLYWIPFLRRLATERPHLRERLVAVSRGGVASWYAGIAARYVDIFDLMPLERMRALTGARSEVVGEKQRGPSPLDDELLRLAAESISAGGWSVLPSSLVARPMRLTKGDDLSAGDRVLEFARLAVPDLPGDVALPNRFVAVRFYGNAPLPRSAETRAAARRLVEQLARSIGVVLLGHDLGLDGHHDHVDDLGDLPGVLSLADVMEPRTNLALQTAVIARAEGFVGTYGGLSYLGPQVGVPSIGFYSHPDQVRPTYLRLAQRSASVLGGEYYALDIRGSASLRVLGVAGGALAPGS